MDDQNEQPSIGWVYALWRHLDLTPEQAQKIADIDKNEQILARNWFLSIWERWDYEFFVFKDILDINQLARYVDKRGQRIKDHEQSLIEDDNSDLILRRIQKALAEINYLETDFLPATSKKFLNHHSINDPRQTKYH